MKPVRCAGTVSAATIVTETRDGDSELDRRHGARRDR